MNQYGRDELKEMVERFTRAIEMAESTGDWVAHLGKMYTDDAVYRWNVGPNREFRADGRSEIEAYAMGQQMDGLKDWQYPYYDFLIDEERGEVIGFFRQISPYVREDGTPYELEGLCGSRFTYGGNYQWREQRDFFDVGNLGGLFLELAGKGYLNPTLRAKISQNARGQLLPGNRLIRPEPSLGEKIRRYLAMIKIVVLAR